MERPYATEQGSNAAPASAPGNSGLRFKRRTLIVGFDTEYRRREPDADDPDHPAPPSAASANEILCYSFAVLEPATPRLRGGVIHLEDGKGSRRHRLSLARFLGHALQEAWDADDLPEVIMLAGHYSRADWCAFRDFPSLKRKVDAVRKTFTSSTRPLELDHPRRDGSMGTFTIYLIDTYLLAPAGKRRLTDLGALVGRPKLELPPGAIEDMAAFRRAEHETFDRYAIRDAEIAALYTARFLAFCANELGLPANRPLPTLAAAAVATFRKMAKDAGLPLHETLGRRPSPTRRRGEQRDGFVPELARHLSFVADCYHGARNEAFAGGPSPEGLTLRDLDVKGAYSTALADVRVPDWKGLHITRNLDELASLDDRMSLAQVRFRFPAGTRFPSLAVRCGDRGLLFPLEGESFCTGAELIVARKLGAELDVLHGLVIPYEPGSPRPFLEFTKHLSTIRSRHAKGSLIELLVKEMMNSLYGKTAQAVDAMRGTPDGGVGAGGRSVFDSREGRLKKLPPSSITAPHLAAHVTGLVRALLSEILAGVPREALVVSATTDGLLTAARIEEIATGPVHERFSALRRMVSGDPTVLEAKTEINGVLSARTRMAFTTEPGPTHTPGSKVVNQKGGARLTDPPADELEHARTWARLYAERTPDTMAEARHLISIRQQWEADADLTTVERRARLNMDYDFKRRIEGPSERNGLLAADETQPWRTAKEFMAYRDDISRWHRVEGRILKTTADLAAFEAWRELGRGRRAAGMRHVSRAQPPLLVMLLRASTRGELGFAKRPHREIIEHLTGYLITRDMLKKAADPRRGEIAPVAELGAEDARALVAWQAAWPHDPVHRLAQGLGSSLTGATGPCPGALP